MQHWGRDLRQRERCDWQAAFGRDTRLGSAVWRVIWDEWMGLFIMSSDRMTNWLTPLWEVLSYSSSLLSQTLSSSCSPSKIVQPQILYNDVRSSVFNWWEKSILFIKDFTSENITNINYLYEKSMDSSVIDQPEADSQTDVFEEKEMITLAPTAHPKNGMPKISIRGNADVQTWRVNIPEDHSLSGWLLHIITCRRKSHYSRAWSLCEGQNSNYGSGWIKTLTRALIKHIWAGVNGAVDPTGTSWKGLTNPKPALEPVKSRDQISILQVKKLINHLHCRPCRNTPALSMIRFVSIHLCLQVTLFVKFHLTFFKPEVVVKIFIPEDMLCHSEVSPFKWNTELHFELDKTVVKFKNT